MGDPMVSLHAVEGVSGATPRRRPVRLAVLLPPVRDRPHEPLLAVL
jgi:hypothetical protein